MVPVHLSWQPHLSLTRGRKYQSGWSQRDNGISPGFTTITSSPFEEPQTYFHPKLAASIFFFIRVKNIKQKMEKVKDYPGRFQKMRLCVLSCSFCYLLRALHSGNEPEGGTDGTVQPVVLPRYLLRAFYFGNEPEGGTDKRLCSLLFIELFILAMKIKMAPSRLSNLRSHHAI